VFPQLFQIPQLFTIPQVFGMGPIPVGPFTVYTYGVLLAASHRSASAGDGGPEVGLHANRVLDLGIYIIIAALVGAKLILLVVEYDHLPRSWDELMSLARSAGVFYGGLIMAVVVAFWYIARHGMPFWRTCDVFAPAIALGHVTGRLGCLAAGCCFGRQTTVPWAITFTNPLAAENVGTPLGIPLHPTQLYEAGAELLILALLLTTERKGRPFSGRTFWAYMFLYAVSRYVIEMYRGDPRGMILGFSTSQFISLVLAPLSLAMLFYLSRWNPETPQEAVRRKAWRRDDEPCRVQVPPPTERSCLPALHRRRGRLAPQPSRPTHLGLDGTRSRCARIRRLIAAGHVTVTREAGAGSKSRGAGPDAKPNLALREGDRITVTLPDAAPAGAAPEALPLEILYQDADLAVLDKPAGMVVHPGAGHGSGTLVNALVHHIADLSGIGGELRPGIVHRLDRGTSGVMVVAKNDAAHRELSRQFEDREVEKEYIALVWGEVQAGRRIEAPIGRDTVNRQKMSARSRHARHAVTRITRAHRLPGLTLCQVAIHTGRTHQIRVHLSGIGHPIVGDSLYGGVHRRVPGDIRAVQRLERPFLHAARLAFTHPRDGRRMEFTAPMPADLLDVLDEIPGWQQTEDGRKGKTEDGRKEEGGRRKKTGEGRTD
jgi:prolipoprotein diacylglyceryl transferase